MSEISRLRTEFCHATRCDRFSTQGASVETALVSPADWQRFERLVARVDKAGKPALPLMRRWLDLYRAPIVAQTATRRPFGPHSIAAVEAVIKQLETDFDQRSPTFGNQTRMQLLLDLMTAEHVGKADPRGWTERLRVELVSRGGAAPGQRPTTPPPSGPRCSVSHIHANRVVACVRADARPASGSNGGPSPRSRCRG